MTLTARNAHAARADASACGLQHEAALSKAEETLEEDTAAFDKFLKESDEKVQQAMSRADAEMKAKQEKVCLSRNPRSRLSDLGHHTLLAIATTYPMHTKGLRGLVT